MDILNLRFFDREGKPLNFEYNADESRWEGKMHFGPLSVGLFDNQHIFVAEKVSNDYFYPALASGATLWFYMEGSESTEFFVYDVLVDDTLGLPYISAADYTLIEHSSQVNLRIPAQVNVAFNPTEEVATDMVLVCGYDSAITAPIEASAYKSLPVILRVELYGEGIEEDERMGVWCRNMGIKFNKEDALILKDYSLVESLPDWDVINNKRKELVLAKEEIFPYIGTYRGLINMIDVFGFKDTLEVKEYWLNIDKTSPYYNKYFLTDIVNMISTGSVTTVRLMEHNRDIKFSKAFQRTGFLSLVYNFTQETGEYDDEGLPVVESTTEFTPKEIFYKMNRLSTKLKDEMLPVNVAIKDVIGQYVYFTRFVFNTWNDTAIIYSTNVNEHIDISMYPELNYGVRDLSVFNRQTNIDGLDFPQTSVNVSSTLPYQYDQQYPVPEIDHIITSIEAYYELFTPVTHDTINPVPTWESNNQSTVTTGCPAVFELLVDEVSILDTKAMRIMDFASKKVAGNVNAVHVPGQLWAYSDGTYGFEWAFIVMSSSGKYQVAVDNSYSTPSNSVIYYSRNYGVTWTMSTLDVPLGDMVYVTSIVMGESNGYVTFICMDTATPVDNVVYESQDYGVSFQISAYSTPSMISPKLSASTDLYFVYAYDGIGNMYRSVVGGDFIEVVGSPTPFVGNLLMGVSDDGQYVTVIDYSGGIFYSSDYGATFDASDAPDTGYWISIVVSDDGLYQSAVRNSGDGGIFYSSDHGATWVESDAVGIEFAYIVGSGSGQYQVCIDFDTNAWYSHNYGATWRQVTAITFVSLGLITMSADGRYVTIADYSDGSVWYSTDYGVTYTWSPSFVGSNTFTCIATSADGMHQTIGISGGYIYVSNENSFEPGENWVSSESVSTDWYAVKTNATGQYQVAATDVGPPDSVYYSHDYGVTWSPAVTLNASVYFIMISDDGAYVTFADSDGRVFCSSDYGVTFDENFTMSGASGTFYMAMSADGQYQVITEGYGTSQFAISYDYGATWEENSSLGIGGSMVAISYTGKIMTIIAYDDYIYRSVDYGATWNVVIFGSYSYYWVVMSDDGQYQTIIDSSNNYVFYSHNHGETWTQYTGTTFSNIGEMVMSADGMYQVLFENGGNIYRSTDYGVTWDLPNIAPTAYSWVESRQMSDSGQYLSAFNSTDSTVWYSTDYGDTWYPSDFTNGSAWYLAMSADGMYQSIGIYGSPIYISNPPYQYGGYYTIDNLKYRDMYEVEWNVKKPSPNPFDFKRRGLVTDLHRLPIFLPYSGTYDVSATLYDLEAGTTKKFKVEFTVVDAITPELFALVRLPDMVEEQIRDYRMMVISDLNDSTAYNIFPNLIREDVTADRLDPAIMDWNYYRNQMGAAMIFNPDLNYYEEFGESTNDYARYFGLDGYAYGFDVYDAASIHELAYIRPCDVTFHSQTVAGFVLDNPLDNDAIRFSGSYNYGYSPYYISVEGVDSPDLDTDIEKIVFNLNNSTHEAVSLFSYTLTNNMVYATAKEFGNEAYQIIEKLPLHKFSDENWVAATMVTILDGPMPPVFAPDYYGVAMSADGKYQTVIDNNNGDIWYSYDYGVNFYLADYPLTGMYSVCMSADGMYQVVADLSGTGFLHSSSDYGATWDLETDITTGFISVCISANGRYRTAASFPQYIYRSTDYGETWSRCDTYYGGALLTGGWSVVKMSASGEHQTAIDLGNAVWNSTDYGLTWTLNETFPNCASYGLAMSADGAYQTMAEISGNIWYSSDYGQTWTDGGYSGSWMRLAMNADGKLQTALDYAGKIYHSYNYGVDWESGYDATSDWYDVAMSADGMVQTVIDLDGLIRVKNLNILNDANEFVGRAWAGGIPSMSYYPNEVVMSADGKYRIVYDVDNTFGASDGLIYYSHDYGASWRAAAVPSRGWGSIKSSADGAYVTALSSKLTPTGNGEVWLSTDYGVTWVQATTPPHVDGREFEDFIFLAMSADGRYQGIIMDGIHLLFTPTTGICQHWYSNDYGVTWAQSDAPNTTGAWRTLAISADGQYQTLVDSDPNHDFNGEPWYSSDYGVTWTMCASGTGASVHNNKITMSADGMYQVIGAGTGPMYYSNDYGVTWTASDSPSADWWFMDCSADGKYVAATHRATGKPWYSVNYGENWTESFTYVKGVLIGNDSYSDIVMSADGMVQLVMGDYVLYSYDYGVSFAAYTDASIDYPYGPAISADGKYAGLMDGYSAVWRSDRNAMFLDKSFTFNFPYWLYDEDEYEALAELYPDFDIKSMFLNAPMQDKLDGDVKNIDYWVTGNNIVIEDNQQRGHLPSVLGDNFLTLANSKVLKSTFTVPRFTSVTYVVNNTANKTNFVWNLYRTGETTPLIRVKDVSFFMWMFAEIGSYDVEVSFTDDKGNAVTDRTDNFTKVVSVDDYGDLVNDWLTSRSYNLG